jgi:hypothetical protein
MQKAPPRMELQHAYFEKIVTALKENGNIARASACIFATDTDRLYIKKVDQIPDIQNRLGNFDGQMSKILPAHILSQWKEHTKQLDNVVGEVGVVKLKKRGVLLTEEQSDGLWASLPEFDSTWRVGIEECSRFYTKQYDWEVKVILEPNAGLKEDRKERMKTFLAFINGLFDGATDGKHTAKLMEAFPERFAYFTKVCLVRLVPGASGSGQSIPNGSEVAQVPEVTQVAENHELTLRNQVMDLTYHVGEMLRIVKKARSDEFSSNKAIQALAQAGVEAVKMTLMRRSTELVQVEGQSILALKKEMKKAKKSVSGGALK